MGEVSEKQWTSSLMGGSTSLSPKFQSVPIQSDFRPWRWGHTGYWKRRNKLFSWDLLLWDFLLKLNWRDHWKRIENFLRKMHHMNWYYRPWQKVLLLFGAEISFLNQEKHHELKIDKSYFCIQPQMRVIFLVILFKRMWRISGMVAFLFELHDVAAEPFFHSFYSCDASGSVDIVGWKYYMWQGNLFGLCHTIGWSESQVWGSLTSDLWHRGKGR